MLAVFILVDRKVHFGMSKCVRFEKAVLNLWIAEAEP